jgi:hypothetical protein
MVATLQPVCAASAPIVSGDVSRAIDLSKT